MRRLILFDIDGTLVWGGPAKGAFHDAMRETYGTAGDVDRVSFAGKTDVQIARQLLSGVGFPARAIEEGFGRLWPRYLAHLEARLESNPVGVLPGVETLLDALAAMDDVAIGLLTGNIAEGARLKLRSAGLWEYFAMGSFGSDHEERDELPAIALSRARSVWGAPLTSAQAVVVGDTPRDVACGKAGGMRTLAVATGSYTSNQLRETGADHVLEDLTATEDVLSWLAG